MDSTLECLTDWMTRQRWYGGKGRIPALRRLGAWDLPSDAAGVRVRTLLIMDDAPRPATLYQVPVTLRENLLPGGGHHLIGRIDSGEFVYDGPHDPVYARALLRMIIGEETAVPDAVLASGHRSDAVDVATVDDGVSAIVLSGEQSNTSIIYSSAASDWSPVICKVFRQLHHGENPDVTLQSALAEAGSQHVPRSVGHVIGEWDDVGRASGRATGHLAFAQEFLPGVQDAWRVALDAAADLRDFTGPAHDLGVATAVVHSSLSHLFPTRATSPGDMVAITMSWYQRLAIALSEVPEIALHRTEIEAVFDAAQAVPWPPMQRIHGDFHLGQVLHAPDRGWVLLDFEGEPLRPMNERDQPDLVLRDIAGMLRSFDYVAGSTKAEHPELRVRDLKAWSHDSRKAFIDGYIAASGDDLRTYRELLDAFELDKAIYEAVYETRNRPTWAPIPLIAIERLLSRGHRRAADVATAG
ncbi:MAG: phosphotransferase [Leifsonia sp.]